MPRPSKKKGGTGASTPTPTPIPSNTNTNTIIMTKRKTRSETLKEKLANKSKKTTKRKAKTAPARPMLTMIPGKEGFYTRLTLEEYYASQEAIEKFLTSQGRGDGGKAQNASLCNQFFPLIKEQKLELADCVLVEPLNVTPILDGGCWVHMNFTAKHKDEEDCSKAVYFAEVCTSQEKVTCLTKLDNDSLDSRDKQCLFCHVDREEAAKSLFPAAVAGYVHHPKDGFRFAENKVVASS